MPTNQMIAVPAARVRMRFSSYFFKLTAESQDANQSNECSYCKLRVQSLFE